jgi:NNP family nitrate/nitrite transporter-like MFS transporter
MGGGVTLMIMPIVAGTFVAAGFLPSEAWRWSMVFPGVALLAMGFVYYFCTQDTPEGNFSAISRKPDKPKKKGQEKASNFLQALRDYRVWVLFLAYGACFGIEITIDNIATLYFVDNFHISIGEAGIIAGLFGVMNIFARALGGIFGDKAGKKFGLKGRILVLGIFLLLEGVGIMVFSTVEALPWAIVTMLIFALFLKMSNGATYSVVPFINGKAMGAVSGIVGAGGNVGAVIAGFLFASENLDYRSSLFIIGIAVTVVSAISLTLAVTKFDGLAATVQDSSELQESLVLVTKPST